MRVALRHRFVAGTGGLLLLILAVCKGSATAQDVTFVQSADEVERYDFVEVTATVPPPHAANPFTDVEVKGTFGPKGQPPVPVDGFCDSADGRVFRIRFMPTGIGEYAYRVTLRQGDQVATHAGTFRGRRGDRRGLLRVDPDRPTHFIWEGTGEHYFWNGTTTYYLMGWDDETIRRSLDRLAGLKVNRLRVLLYGRNKPKPWGQPVVPTDCFKLHLNPWPAARPDDIADPGFDLARFNVEHWQKYERLLRCAREKDVIVSVIFYIGGQVLPTPFAADSPEENLYYRYGIARLAAFSNVTWDLGNEYNFHRKAPDWADRLGHKVKGWDPYGHLASAHNVVHRTPQSTWCDMQLIQRWDSGQNAFMLGQREEQAKTGRIIPQINEEYGYEDLWEKTPGQRAVETRRRCAWEIAMAGCYQTAGESARTGTGVPPDTGGGWINGRGDDSMTMLRRYVHLVDFFTAFDWWTLEPRNDLVAERLPCLARERARYVLYLPTGGHATVTLAEGKYRARWFDPREGTYAEAGVAVAPAWTSPEAPDREDWVLVLDRDDAAVDRTPLRLVSASVAGPDKVLVSFSKSADERTATAAAHYAIDGGVTVKGAAIADPSGRTVLLSTSALAEDVRYTLMVHSVRDRAAPPNAIDPGAQATFLRRNPARPLVVLALNEGKGQTAANTGAMAESHPSATLTAKWPQWSKNVPPGGGAASLDFGREAGEYAADLRRDAPEALRGLVSFTITGWANCRSHQVGPGGNRIVHMADTMGTRAGLDLVVEKRGDLALGVNAYPDQSPARSRTGAVPADPEAGQENWRFFAVAYDSTAAAEHVKFYFGGPQDEVGLDRAVTYPHGPVGPNTGPLTLGAFNSTTRSGKGDRVFRGLLDEVRVFGSTVDGTGALGLKEIRAIQRGK